LEINYFMVGLSMQWSRHVQKPVFR